MKFEQTSKSALLISYTIKFIEDSTYLTKTLEVADAFLDNLAKICDRKNIIFMQYGTEWLIYKFNITKPYFEKVIKNDDTRSFHKFVYSEKLYPDPTKFLPAFFHNRASLRDVFLVKYQEKIKFS